MFILFDVRCQKCNRSFKVEADGGSAPPTDRVQYWCACPRCSTTVSLQGEQGTATATATGWAVRATAVGGVPPGHDIPA